MTSAIPCCCNGAGGDAHLAQFYRTALGNPALRPLLRRTGLIELNDESRLQGLREALVRARDDDGAGLGRGRPAGRGAAGYDRAAPPPAEACRLRRARRDGAPDLSEIERVIRSCGAHLLRSFTQKRLHPGLRRLQPDRRSRPARPRIPDGADRAERARLQELDAAVQPGADLHRPLAGACPDQPALERHRRADVAADADPPPLGLLRRVLHRGAVELRRDGTGVARSGGRRAPRVTEMVDFCLNRQPRGGTRARRPRLRA